MPKDAPRYRIGELRWGTSIHTPFGWIQTSGRDGAVALTDQQVKYLKKAGHELERVADAEPEEVVEEIDVDAQRRIATQAQLAGHNATEHASLPAKSELAPADRKKS